MTTFSCLRRPSWILATILEKKMLQKYSHNSSIIPTNFELSNFKTEKKVLTPTSYLKIFMNKICNVPDLMFAKMHARNLLEILEMYLITHDHQFGL